MTPAEEARLATFIARPEWCEVRRLVEQIAPGCTAPIDAVVLKVRREQWGDRS